MEGVKHAGILVCATKALEARIEFSWIMLGQLRDGTNAESTKISLNSRADGNEVTKLTSSGYKGLF